ncbi:beta-CASP ribonuclease aCPSF1 [Methanosarcinales archaeon]|nr:MAG: beta-CASP ribonuclease aCPSF1 [Methanosarcinales archaeon]
MTTADERLQLLKKRIKELLPKDVRITDVQFEGPSIVIYTEDTHRFLDDSSLVRMLAKELKKRISVRPSSSLLKPPEEAMKILRKELPEESGIKDIYFNIDRGEVIIEAEKPGVCIGKQGVSVKEIAKKIGWKPLVIRAPPIRSSIIENIRRYLRDESEFRREFLKKVGKRIFRKKLSTDNWLRVTMLGGCREVGRNAFLVSTPETKVLIDCGVSVGSEMIPYLYVPEVSPLDSIDAVILTHAHLDHSGLLPLLFQYGYEGPVYMTQPTRDMMALLLLDYIDVTSRDGGRIPYKSSHIRDVIRHTITLKYGEVTDIAPDIKLTLYNAGHILGSSIVHLHIGNGAYNIVFTGDIKYEHTFLFEPAFNGFQRIEALVIESTYGGPEDIQPPRKDAEKRLKEVIERTINRGGKVIIPAFAVGRSQEVMIALEHMKLPVTVYLDGMIWEATAVHTAYPEYLSRDLKEKIYQEQNPFLSEIFEQVDDVDKRREVIEEKEPSVILTTSGMLNGGPVLEYLRSLAPDEKNTLIFVGYQAEGTLGRRIQKGWKEIQFSTAGKIENVKINMEVETIDGFSGHSDRNQLISYVADMRTTPSKIVCVHGEGTKCIALASALHKRFSVETIAPHNLETIRFL